MDPMRRGWEAGGAPLPTARLFYGRPHATGAITDVVTAGDAGDGGAPVMSSTALNPQRAPRPVAEMSTSSRRLALARDCYALVKCELALFEAEAMKDPDGDGVTAGVGLPQYSAY